MTYGTLKDRKSVDTRTYRNYGPAKRLCVLAMYFLLLLKYTSCCVIIIQIFLKEGAYVMHIKHVTLRVRNLEKSIQFYETITELAISRRFQSEPAEIAFMTNGNGETENQ